jgi:hypothetical protein
MKRIILTAAAAALVLVATARADPALHDKFSFSFDVTFPAGTLCDFTYHGTSTVDINTTFVPGANQFTYFQTQHNTHTNVDTNYTLAEVDKIFQLGKLDSPTSFTVGIFWHLRDPSGKIVLVKAGEVTFDFNTGELISFTPNTSADQTFAEIICPALGGSPA